MSIHVTAVTACFVCSLGQPPIQIVQGPSQHLSLVDLTHTHQCSQRVQVVCDLAQVLSQLLVGFRRRGQQLLLLLMQPGRLLLVISLVDDLQRARGLPAGSND